MSCPACTAAQRDPRRDEFGVGCISCDARALALVAVSASRETLGKVFGERVEAALRHEADSSLGFRLAALVLCAVVLGACVAMVFA